MDVLTSLEPILEQSKSVQIDRDSIRRFAANFDKKKTSHWLTVSPFDIDQFSEREKIGFLTTLNAISFCYWGNPKWEVEYAGQRYDGAQAMIVCLGRAIEQGVPLFDASFLAGLDKQDLKNILKGNVEIPLLEERLRFLNEFGRVVAEEYKCDFRYLLNDANFDASRIVDLIVETFSSFEDSAVYEDKKVYFNKRAQLLTSDIHNCFTKLTNDGNLTACADYKLPQVLRRHQILHYGADLQARISSGNEIEKGSVDELEIRANTIQAVEFIKMELPDLTSSQINDYLWLEGQIKYPSDEPYHLTRTTAY